jgi:hypothetical protein
MIKKLLNPRSEERNPIEEAKVEMEELSGSPKEPKIREVIEARRPKFKVVWYESKEVA